MAETGPDTDLRDQVNSLGAEVTQITDHISKLTALVEGISTKNQEPSLEQGDETVTVHDAYKKGFTNAVQGQKLIAAAGYSDVTTAEPELLEVTREARQAAIRMAASRVLGEDGEDDDEDVEDRGKGAQAELPPGVPDWPPRPFLARQKVFTKPWQVYLLKQGDASRPDTDPRIAEGDCLSNVVLWLDYANIASRLLDAAVKDGDLSAVGPLVEQVVAYQGAAYEAARMRVDDVSMTLLNRPAAELYTKTSRMELESTTMRAPGIKFLRKTNAAMLTAKAKAIATKNANQAGQIADNGVKQSSPTKNKSKTVQSKPKDNSLQKQAQKPAKSTQNEPRPTGAPQAAASTAAEQSGRTGAAGGL